MQSIFIDKVILRYTLDIYTLVIWLHESAVQKIYNSEVY